MKNIMVDIETLDNTPTSVILSIGACEFDHTGVGRTFYTVVDRSSCEEHGLTIGADTLRWWEKQSPEAKAVLSAPGLHLKDALNSLSEFFTECDAETFWGNGATFDNVIVDHAYRATKINRPWKFWNDRCFRTLKALYPQVPAPKKNDLAHNALADAVFQAEHAAAILAHLKGA